MAETLQAQIEKLRRSIKGLEAQQDVLGDEIVNPALEVLRFQLAELEQQAALDEQSTAQEAPVEERRMVTILFFDMVGSTSIAEKLDPEDWRQVVVKIHTALGESVANHHGSVVQYLGDGLLALFGAKDASEYDPENAIRASLEGLAKAANLPASEKVQLRAGIHTGLVVVGELGSTAHKEFTASGDAMNLAARLQAAAPPGGILISHDTYRYVRGVFDLTPRPPLMVKGRSESLQTYLVRRAKPRPFRSAARGVAGVETRTIGREAELKSLQKAYRWAAEQHGLVWAQLLGEPGVGKSRILEDMNDWIDLYSDAFHLLRARAFPDDASQPFALVRRMWFDRFQIPEDAQLDLAEEKWVDRFKEFAGQNKDEEAAHALGLLVGLSFQNSPYIRAMRNDPSQVKGRAFVVSRGLFDAVRQEQPVAILLEDLQWADAASWEYLMEVFLNSPANESTNGLFILGTARPEWHPPEELADLLKFSQTTEQTAEHPPTGQAKLDFSSSKRWGIQISLAPLTDPETRELAFELFKRVEDIPGKVVDLLVERSEGMPYFAEEMVNWFIDHDILDIRGERWRFLPERLTNLPLPATLQHLLLTRLSSLTTTERAALQRGAIFGRQFWTGGVEALGVHSSAETLEDLQPRGFVEEQSESRFQGDTEWSFRHNLLQEVTYESVLKRERAELHRVAAGWLEQQAHQAGRLDEFAGLLGDHLERAGELSSAAGWYLRAGLRAMRQGAPREAVSFYTRSLKLLPADDRQRRWEALIGREEALGVLSDAEPWQADLSALLELASTFDDSHYLAEVLFRQAVFGMLTGDRPVIEKSSRDALEAARRSENRDIEAKALVLTAVADLNRGDQSTAIEHSEAALRLARSLENQNVLAYVLSRAAYCYSKLDDIARCHLLLKEQIELDHLLGNRSQEAIGLGNLGVSYASIGMYKQARPLEEQARTISESLGARRTLGYNLMSLGNIHRATGDLRKAQKFTEQALQVLTQTQDTLGKAYVLIDYGIVLLAMGDGYGASRRLMEAMELALSLELEALVCEVNANLSAAAVFQGQLDQAREFANNAWDYLKGHSREFGMEYSGEVYRSCAETFDALGDEEHFREVLETGYQVLIEEANKINNTAWRKSFLENVPNNRAIMEMWERKQTG